MTDSPLAPPAPRKKRGRPFAGVVIEGEAPAERLKRQQREAQTRYRASPAYARRMLRYWQRVVDLIDLDERGAVPQTRRRRRKRTPEELEINRERTLARYYKKRQERLDHEAIARGEEPWTPEPIDPDASPSGFEPWDEATQRRTAWRDMRERLVRLVQENRASGRGVPVEECAFFKFDPLHYAPYSDREKCAKCGLRIKTPLGPRLETTNLEDWGNCGEFNCFALRDVEDEIFWPKKDTDV